jgi:toxin FitB
VDRGHAEVLDAWIDSIELSFSNRILPVDVPVARLWGELSAIRPRPVVDTVLAATALINDLTLVTRNVRDVAGTGVSVINPWQGG